MLRTSSSSPLAPRARCRSTARAITCASDASLLLLVRSGHDFAVAAPSVMRPRDPCRRRRYSQCVRRPRPAENRRRHRRPRLLLSTPSARPTRWWFRVLAPARQTPVLAGSQLADGMTIQQSRSRHDAGYLFCLGQGRASAAASHCLPICWPMRSRAPLRPGARPWCAAVTSSLPVGSWRSCVPPRHQEHRPRSGRAYDRNRGQARARSRSAGARIWANSQARRCRMLAISRRALSERALVRACSSPRRQRSGRVPTLGIRAKHAPVLSAPGASTRGKHARRWERRPCSVMGYSASALAPEHSKWGRAQCRQRSPDLSGITPAAIDRASPTDGLPYATCVPAIRALGDGPLLRREARPHLKGRSATSPRSQGWQSERLAPSSPKLPGLALI